MMFSGGLTPTQTGFVKKLSVQWINELKDAKRTVNEPKQGLRGILVCNYPSKYIEFRLISGVLNPQHDRNCSESKTLLSRRENNAPIYPATRSTTSFRKVQNLFYGDHQQYSLNCFSVWSISFSNRMKSLCIVASLLIVLASANAAIDPDIVG